jgi:hypothetical protein
MAAMWRGEVGTQATAMTAAGRGSRQRRAQAARRCQARAAGAAIAGREGVAAVRLTSSRRSGGDNSRRG